MLPPLTFTGKEPGCFYLGEVILSLKRGERFAQGFSLSLAHTHIYTHTSQPVVYGRWDQSLNPGLFYSIGYSIQAQAVSMQLVVLFFSFFLSFSSSFFKKKLINLFGCLGLSSGLWGLG